MAGAPQREAAVDEKTQKEMMAMWHKKQVTFRAWGCPPPVSSRYAAQRLARGTPAPHEHGTSLRWPGQPCGAPAGTGGAPGAPAGGPCGAPAGTGAS